MKIEKVLFASIIMILFLVQTANSSSLQISYSLKDSSIYTNSQTTLLIQLTNLATNEIKDIKITLFSDSLEISPQFLTIDKLSPSNSIESSFIINSKYSKETSYKTITLTIDYKIESNSYEKTIVIPIKVISKPNLDLVLTSNNSIQPNEEKELIFNLINNGDGIARDVQITFNQSSLIFEQTSIFIKEIQPNEQIPIKIKVIPNPDVYPNLYQIQALLTYFDSSRTISFSSQKLIPIKIYEKPKILITLENLDIQNDKGYIEIKISNAGKSKIFYAKAEINSSLPLKSSNIIYIGNIDPDDYDIERIEFVPTSNKNQIQINLSFQDVFGNNYNLAKTFYIEITKKESKNYSIYFLALIILILIAIFFVYKKIKKKRK
ncbi:MAG: hypothetical protein B6U78_00070 [Candidatus Aenigmarchaeota archaeon ex4484_224]|nr:MAG: hypothetical protein B6U78_00070 [Candidatus Aenigmarchaeota archaeon ex4484_224]